MAPSRDFLYVHVSYHVSSIVISSILRNRYATFATIVATVNKLHNLTLYY